MVNAFVLNEPVPLSAQKIVRSGELCLDIYGTFPATVKCSLFSYVDTGTVVLGLAPSGNGKKKTMVECTSSEGTKPGGHAFSLFYHFAVVFLFFFFSTTISHRELSQVSAPGLALWLYGSVIGILFIATFRSAASISVKQAKSSAVSNTILFGTRRTGPAKKTQ